MGEDGQDTGGLHAHIGRVEIPVAEMERAAEFYRRAFGWEVEAVEWEGEAYCTVRPPASAGATGEAEGREPGGGDRARSGVGAGLTTRHALGTDRPLVVIHVEGDCVEGAPLEAALERIVAAGGSVESGPEEIGEMGRFARFRDPEGNLFGLWEGG